MLYFLFGKKDLFLIKSLTHSFRYRNCFVPSGVSNQQIFKVKIKRSYCAYIIQRCGSKKEEASVKILS